MGVAERGEYADGGLDDVAQGIHLARLAYSGLEQAYPAVLREQPHGQGDTYLRVV